MSENKLFDLKYQLLAYGSHHHNPWNVGIHITCVPLILWSGLVWAAKSGPLIASPSASAVAAGGVASLVSKAFQFLPPNAGTLMMLGYSAYYVKLDKIAGSLATPLLLLLAKHATDFQATNPNADKIALGVHVVSWILQFIGHGVAEKRAPKLLENLVQALVLAPYFVFYEVLFMVGYRPQLRNELETLIVADIKQFKAKKAAEAAKKEL